MLKFLEGSVLDLGPTFWAGFILCCLILIEVLQLGPRCFASRKKKSATSSGGDEKRPKSKNGKSKSKGLRRRRRAGTYLEINNFILGAAENCAVIVLASDRELHFDASTVRKLKTSPVGQVVAQSSDGGRGSTVYQSPSGDYVVAFGEESEVTVLGYLNELWQAAQDQQGSNVKSIILYSSSVPSPYSVQRLVEVFKSLPGADKVNVTVRCRQDEEDESEETTFAEKEEYLMNHNILMETVQ